MSKGYVPRFRQKLDENHRAIVATLQYNGALVGDLSNAGGGIPDLVVGFRGVLFLVEVKTPKGALSPKQKEFFAQWSEYPTLVIRTVDEAMDVMEVLRNAYDLAEIDWTLLVPHRRRAKRSVDDGTGAGRRRGRRSGDAGKHAKSDFDADY
jgi:hypothetical protein